MDKENGWELTEKHIVTSRDSKRRIHTELIKTIDSIGTLVNSQLRIANHYPNDILSDSLVLKWDDESNEWGDTLFYIKKDLEGNTLKKIVLYPERCFSTINLVKKTDIFKYNINKQMTYHIKLEDRDTLYEYFYAYNQNNELVDVITHKYKSLDCDTYTIEKLEHKTFQYDSKGNKVQLIKQKKDHINENWINTEKIYYTYYEIIVREKNKQIKKKYNIKR